MNDNKVGIYCRLSDEDRYKRDKNDDSESIANQKSMLLKYALDKGWEVINVYSDDDWSGVDINRPAFQRLIEDCKNGVINIVLCKTQSRFSRDMEVIERYIHNKFVEWNVRFVSIVDNADTLVEGNKKARQINGLINEWYLEDLSENIKKSLKNKREDGLFLGSFAPYGYIKDPKNKNKLIIDPIAAKVVKDIFELYKSGKGYYLIARYLNDSEIPTPSIYKKEQGSNYQCRKKEDVVRTKWNQDTIRTILKNEVYIGNLIQGKRTNVSYKNKKTIVKSKKDWTFSYNTHDSIIDLETWNYVQKKLNSKVRASKKTGEVYKLSKKVYCKECGKVFTKQQSKTKDGITCYMKCNGYRIANVDCQNKYSIRCDVLEKIILDEINKQLDIYFNIDILSKDYTFENLKLSDNKILKKEALKQEKEELSLKIDKRNNYYKKLYEDKLNGIISNDDFMMFKTSFQKEIDDYKKRIFVIDNEIANIKPIDEIISNSKSKLNKYRHINKLTKEVVDEFVDVVKIGKFNSKTNNREIDVELNIIKLD